MLLMQNMDPSGNGGGSGDGDNATSNYCKSVSDGDKHGTVEEITGPKRPSDASKMGYTQYQGLGSYFGRMQDSSFS
jgi:hypothetical protein